MLKEMLTTLYLQKRLLSDPCPIALMKAVKNETELKGMKYSHVCNLHFPFNNNISLICIAQRLCSMASGNQIHTVLK